MHRKIISIIVSLTIIIASVVLIPSKSTTAEAQEITFSGYGWSTLTGWMQVAGTNYGIKATPQGTSRINLSGYAWTSTLGWISFDPSAVVDCADRGYLTLQSGTSTCAPYIDMTGSGPYRVRGFARACAVFESGCSGTIKDQRIDSSTEVGGWDGYISLNSGDGAWGWQLSADKSKITGYAWGDSVIGWLDVDASCTGCDIPSEPDSDTFTSLGCAAPADNYFPRFSWSTSPAASSCELVQTAPSGARVDIAGSSKTDYLTTQPGFQVPGNEPNAQYKLFCTKGARTVDVGSLTVARCAIDYGFCPAPNGTIAKVDAAGSNCPAIVYCPGKTFTAGEAGGSCTCPDGVTAKIDTAGSNCPSTPPTNPPTKPIKIIEI